MATGTDWETSEFSLNEVLYMGHDTLVFIVEETIGDSMYDPFEILARLELELGKPIALS